MQIQHDVFIHFPHDKLEELAVLLQTEFAANRTKLTNLKEILMSTKEELTATLAAQATQAEKVKAEVIAAIAALGNTATTPEQDALLARISAALGGLDQLNPDAAPTPA